MDLMVQDVKHCAAYHVLLACDSMNGEQPSSAFNATIVPRFSIQAHQTCKVRVRPPAEVFSIAVGYHGCLPQDDASLAVPGLSEGLTRV